MVSQGLSHAGRVFLASGDRRFLGYPINPFVKDPREDRGLTSLTGGGQSRRLMSSGRGGPGKVPTL
jgi:hypothetical protein